jgi:hypothetical protein
VTVRSRALAVALGSIGFACDVDVPVGAQGEGGAGEGGTATGGIDSTGGAGGSVSGTGGSVSGAGGGASGGQPTVIWSDDFESGDLSGWEPLAAGVGPELVWGGGELTLASGEGRNSSIGVAFTMDTTVDSPSHGARLYRAIEQAPAYYSAWFRLTQFHEVSDWWAIMVFQGRTTASSLENVSYLWDIRLVSEGGQALSLQFFEPTIERSHEAASAVSVPMGEWFHLEVYLEYSPPEATAVRVDLNGEQVFDLVGLVSGAPEIVLWGVGNGGAGLSPTTSILLVDDPVVSTGPIGPARSN